MGAATAALVTLLLAGCAKPDPQKLPEKQSFNADPDHLISFTRWEVMRPPEGDSTFAAVNGTPSKSLIMIACYEPNNTLMAQIITERKFTGDPSRHTVQLKLDEGGFVWPTWNVRTDSEGTAFGIVYELKYDGDFWPLVDNLKKHDRAVAIFRSDNREVLRHNFSLVGAAAAIDAVLKRCGQPEAPKGPLLEQYWSDD